MNLRRTRFVSPLGRARALSAAQRQTGETRCNTPAMVGRRGQRVGPCVVVTDGPSWVFLPEAMKKGATRSVTAFEKPQFHARISVHAELQAECRYRSRANQLSNCAR